MKEALAEYERRRNEASAANYEENLAVAISAAVRNNPEEATRRIKARQRMIDPSEFFNPQNLRRLLGGGQAASV